MLPTFQSWGHKKLLARNHPDIDLVNDNVCTKFGLIQSFHSQDIEQKLNSDINQGCNSVAKMMHYNPNIDLVNDSVYTNFGLILSIHS